jgi:hypothetical protein
MTSVTNKVLESTETNFIFFCEKCSYKTNDKSNYKKHCLTARHKIVTNGDNKSTFGTKSTSDILQCIKCSKTYKSRNGLWLHSKNCSRAQLIENPVIDANLIIKLIQQNENLQNLLVQQAAEHSQKQSELIHKLVDREP